MAQKIKLDEGAAMELIQKLNSVRSAMDTVESGLWDVKTVFRMGWSGKAHEQFKENCLKLRQKAADINSCLDKDVQGLYDAAGIFRETETKNAKLTQDLSTDNIFV